MHSPPTDEVVQRAQSSPIGVVLILGITLSAAVAIVVFGGAAMENAQEDSRIGQAEQAMTQFDSRTAQVALGNSDSQTVSLGPNRGTYRIDEDAGSLKIYHENWEGYEDPENSDPEYIYGTEAEGESLGAVVYETGDTTIAYQGGGVWRKDADGGVSMVSPPEFHYRKATLTFPLVRVTGSGSASGNVQSSISRLVAAEDIFPRDQSYPDADDTPYDNPVQDGTMIVEVQSEYCQAWDRYFKQRTEGEVTETCSANDTVTAELLTLGTQGDFSVTRDSDVLLRGLENSEDLKSLELEFGSDSSADFNNYGWSVAGESGDRQFELYIENRGGGDNCGSEVRIVYYYSEDGGDTYQTWVLDGDDKDIGTNPYTIECNGDDEERLTVDMLDASREMEYVDADDSNEGGNNDDLLAFDYSGDFDSSANPLGSDQEPVDDVTAHYFSTIGDMDLDIDERTNGEGTGLSDDMSSGHISYEGGGDVVTFLHITENEIQVELD